MQRGDPKIWTFPLEDFNEPSEMTLIHDWKEIVLIKGDVQYSDGIGGEMVRPFCWVYTNYGLLLPNSSEGALGGCDDTLPRLRTALKHKQEAKRQKK